ncbi:hypothetical protein [Alphaentomopoxvirus acuprea]|uniref:Uncharacterized protein n=1 Tax=Alphaentomopoxvirus acuprea TaxID=62099 RepID=W6JKW3_9POXV|nr:hypothetical protein BA82_gp075 [Anomala cuprea entomopoxvirus]BAO49435.1 hypothetical protein [Anomala cuprea entomopoxvirus]
MNNNNNNKTTYSAFPTVEVSRSEIEKGYGYFTERVYIGGSTQKYETDTISNNTIDFKEIIGNPNLKGKYLPAPKDLERK